MMTCEELGTHDELWGEMSEKFGSASTILSFVLFGSWNTSRSFLNVFSWSHFFRDISHHSISSLTLLRPPWLSSPGCLFKVSPHSSGDVPTSAISPVIPFMCDLSFTSHGITSHFFPACPTFSGQFLLWKTPFCKTSSALITGSKEDNTTTLFAVCACTE